MAKQVSLKAQVRPGTGRQCAKKTRTAGMIPGIIYGAHTKPISIQVDSKTISNLFKHAASENMLVDLALDEGGKVGNRLAFIQDIQRSPTTDQILHLDFHEIRADEKMHARVHVVPVGEPEGVKTNGGILEQVLRELDVECLPKDLPDRITVDVSALLIGQGIHVAQIKAPSNVTILNHADAPVFAVLAPAKEEEVAAAPAEGAAAEPELVKKKAGEEGEAAPAGDAKAAAAPKAEGKDAKAAPGAKSEAKPAAKAEKK